MLSIDKISNDKEATLIGLKKRGFRNLEVIDKLIELNSDRKQIQQKLDQILFESNTISKEIAEIFKSGNKSNDVEGLKSKSAELKIKSKDLSDQLDKTKSSILSIITTIPNLPDKDVPEGLTVDDNLEVFTSGQIKDSNESLKNHWDLAKELDIIDFELGNKITGAGFPVYKDKGAKLQRALINYFIDKNTEAGYKEIQVPILVNEDSGMGTGQLPDKEGQMYHVNEDNLYLIPTAEVPVTNIFRNTIVKSSELPICLTSYTPCFRREAGSYGAHVRGLNRLHQFDKVEIVRIENPETSYKALTVMVEHVKNILIELELPFRILRLCGGDLGFTSSLTYDFEVYSAAQKKWLEVSSVSNFETFQSNRLKLRIDNNGTKNLAHTLNGSSLALPRIVACILENFQDESSIKIPKALINYTGFEEI
mgnify:CR=1 FL=1